MAVTSEHVRALADAYREALNEGDVAFRGNWLDQKLLVAVVVKSATDQYDWLATRVPGGGGLTAELEGLVSALGKHDVVGANLASTKKWLRKQTLILIGAVCALVAWPAWAGTVAALAGNIFLGAYNFGYWLGLLLGGGVLAYLWGPGKAIALSFSAPKSIGVRVNELFVAHVRPPLEAMRSRHGKVVAASDLDTPVVRELRGWAYVLLVLSVGVFCIVALQFVLGVIAAMKCTADAPIMDYPWTPENDTEVCS
ncbi:hypothetical protein ACODT5_20780 [Streptomyces sp. 5.8]|uniref:hypothetical protein n=1 Tax=Streptomyces sp. 5.8 TaxID=3406571 RepID=UPI003BB64942